MKKILLPTDFSNNSWNAIEYALKLFKDEVCTFYLLHTYTPAVYHVEYVLINPSQFGLGDSIREEVISHLKDVEKKIKKKFKNPNHKFERIAAFNTLILEIQSFVEENEIDYIVMGTKGASGLQEVLFGSNTVHVFKNVKCPVLAIPDGFDFEIPREVLFPTDYEMQYQEDDVKPLIDIVSLYNTRVNIMNVSYGYELSEAQESNKALLEKYFGEIAHLFHSISNQDVPEAINNFQLRAKINLLVMINNKHSFFENLFFKSKINHIGFHLNVPFLVIPART
ncbi:universal stress protein [Flavobacteriaceae bacterium SZ-1-7]|uniref:universal stress protein n=1 Tax=Tamlana sedimenti TaxID=3134126 RepID=UPI003123127F